MGAISREDAETDSKPMFPKDEDAEILHLKRRILIVEDELKDIPVIVMTADQTTEVDCLKIGAIDFIPKPYPTAEVIQARITRCIELSEKRSIIQSTERDSLTGLFNLDYFLRFVRLHDQHYNDMPMDAIILDVNRFRMLNERYGKQYGDSILARLGGRVRQISREIGGLGCRRNADTFYIYCPHQEDYSRILDKASEGLVGENVSEDRVRLRMGVYSQVDKSLQIERRFDHAKAAANTVKSGYLKAIGIYDTEMYEAELFMERLLEDNGLILELDRFVWRKTAERIRVWKDRQGFSVPVSVNVSRIDMLTPNLKSVFSEILKEYRLSTKDLILEITESAYTGDSDQVIATAMDLRGMGMGFRIEMDDFGTGYSSLGMLSKLPIDALKLDMSFIRSAFRETRDVRMIELIIDIADYLHVPVVAEGVETEEQYLALKELGCDMAQGYYFSKPVPLESFEHFLRERAEVAANGAPVH